MVNFLERILFRNHFLPKENSAKVIELQNKYYSRKLAIYTTRSLLRRRNYSSKFLILDTLNSKPQETQTEIEQEKFIYLFI